MPTKTCSVSGCQRQHLARGLCRMHYLREWKAGSLKNIQAPTLEERFMRKVKKSNGCWDWTGAKITRGYGTMRVNGKTLKAHRVAWELYRGSIPAQLWVLHTCDNPSCVNPAHLYPGTSRENTNDMMKRLRFFSKLSVEEVNRIRTRCHGAPKGTQRRVAKEFGVTPSAICILLKHKTWNNVPGVST